MQNQTPIEMPAGLDRRDAIHNCRGAFDELAESIWILPIKPFFVGF